MKIILIDLLQFFLNHIVGYIPIWEIRKLFYRLLGMKIGRNSRILMGCRIFAPWKITIGENTYINENCFLDGRGKLVIGNNVSISMYSKIITGTHDVNSKVFTYIPKPVVIHDNVWVGINGIVLPGCLLPMGMILAAGSVAIYSSKNTYDEYGIYSGVPAKEIGKRKIHEEFCQEKWKPLFR